MDCLCMHLHSAREIMAGICSEAVPDDINVEEMDILIQELQQNIGCVEFRLSQLAVKIKTPILIDYLQQNKVDYTLLMYLQVDENFTKNKAFISYLKGLCEQMCVPYKNRAFYDLVWNHFKANGVQSITPNKFIINRNKEDILHEYQRIVACNEWRQHNPFFFQTFITTKSVKGFQKLVFFITRTWQDGVIRMLEILKEGNFVLGTNMFDAHGVFEHFIDDDTLTGLMLDSELLSRALPALSADEISAEMLRFPAMISHDLVAQGLLHDESFLHVTVKDKTRPRGDCIKVSFHFLLHVCATKSQQKRVIEQFMRERKKEIDKGLLHMKETKTLPEDRALPIAWYAFDAKAATSNGFTTPFARKDRSDPYSRKHSDAVYCLGMQISETLCPVNVQDLHGRDLTDSERLCLLQEQLYTTPKLHMASYAVELKETEKEKKCGAIPPIPQAGCRADGGRVSSAQLHLPAWLLSALGHVSGRGVEVYTSPSSLECKRTTLPKASQSRARLYQIPSSWCANSMTKGEVHIHSSNCTVVAVDEELKVVYMTCVTGAAGHKITDNSSGVVKVVNMHSALGSDGKVQPVEEVKGRCIHWVMLDETDMGLLMEKVTGKEPVQKKPKI